MLLLNQFWTFITAVYTIYMESTWFHRNQCMYTHSINQIMTFNDMLKAQCALPNSISIPVGIQSSSYWTCLIFPGLYIISSGVGQCALGLRSIYTQMQEWRQPHGWLSNMYYQAIHLWISKIDSPTEWCEKLMEEWWPYCLDRWHNHDCSHICVNLATPLHIILSQPK